MSLSSNHSSQESWRGPGGARSRPAGFLILIASAICVPLAFFTVGASSAWNAAEEETVTSLERVTTMLHEHALRAFETHEAMMTALDQRVEGFTWPLTRERQSEMNAFLSALRRSAIPVAGLAIVDPENRIAAASFSGQATPVDLRDRAFIANLRKQNRRIMVGRVMRSDVNSARTFAIMRRRITPQDEESGSVMSLFDVSFFKSFFEPLRRERGDMIALVREDGELSVVARIEVEGVDSGADEAGARAAIGEARQRHAPHTQGERPPRHALHGSPHRRLSGLSRAGAQPREREAAMVLRVAPYALLLLASTSFMLLLIWRMASATRREQEAYARLAVEEANHPAKTQSNVRMKRLMDTNVFGVVTFSEKGVIEANDAFLMTVGRSRADFKAQGFSGRRRPGSTSRRTITSGASCCGAAHVRRSKPRS